VLPCRFRSVLPEQQSPEGKQLAEQTISLRISYIQTSDLGWLQSHPQITPSIERYKKSMPNEGQIADTTATLRIVLEGLKIELMVL